MALTNSSISNGRAKNADISRDLDNVRGLIGNLKTSLGQDENYRMFIEGTNFGKNQDDKIQKIMGLLDQNLTAETNSLTSKLNNFFDHQEELNRRAQMQSGNSK